MQTKRKHRIRTSSWLRPLVSWVLGLLFVAPFAWLVITALKPQSETFSMALGPWTLDNFEQVLFNVPLPRYMLNTFFVAGVITVVALVLHSMCAYALARLRFRGSELVLNIVVATFMVSTPVILVPLYLIVRSMNLLDTFWAVILPGLFNAYGIFLMRQTMVSIPRELEEAATLDGCTYWQKYRLVILPLIRPTLVSLGVLFFLANWNSFMWPRTVLASQELWMVQQGLSTMQGQYGAAWNLITAAAVIVALPTLLMFLIGQRTLVKSIMTTGLK